MASMSSGASIARYTYRYLRFSASGPSCSTLHCLRHSAAQNDRVFNKSYSTTSSAPHSNERATGRVLDWLIHNTPQDCTSGGESNAQQSTDPVEDGQDTSSSEPESRNVTMEELSQLVDDIESENFSPKKTKRKLQKAKKRLAAKLQTVGSETEDKMERKARGAKAKGKQTEDEGGPILGEDNWNAESWKNDWGPDELSPKFVEQNSSTDVSKSQKFPWYDRRIEGLLLPSEEQSVLVDIGLPTEKDSIANLAHGLDRVLFNQGVHWVQDPRSHVYNFSPYVQNVPDVKDFAFEKLPGFIRSSRDDVLFDLAKAEGKRFAGSTSSLTGILSHIYFLISDDHPVNISSLSKGFPSKKTNFTPGQRMPVSMVFNHRDGVHLIDSGGSDTGDDDNSDLGILMWQGTMLEYFLTKPRSLFEPLLRSSGLNQEESNDRREAYRYAKSKSFVMRSQLDCHDSRLPGTGVFDIKTRAVVPIRLDQLNYKENSGYLIRTLLGPLESFEKEYFDLIRSAFLKYSFQARIGNMDGVFVAYHNTARMFGFQYIPLSEMDDRLYGAEDRGNRVFEKCVSLLEIISEEIASCFPGQSVACMAETLEGTRVLKLWLRPLDDEKADLVQLEVRARNYLDNNAVSGTVAVDQAEKSWSLLWSISRIALPQVAIRAKFEAAKLRRFRCQNLPTGVSLEELEKLIPKDFGFGVDPQTLMERGQRTLPPHLFQSVERNFAVQKLRKLSRNGRNDLLKWEEENQGIPTVVWRQTDPCDGDLKVPLNITAEEVSDDVKQSG